MITRRLIILPLAGLAGAATMAGLVPPPHRLSVLAQVLLQGAPVPPRPDMPVFAATEGNAESLIGAGLGPRDLGAGENT